MKHLPINKSSIEKINVVTLGCPKNIVDSEILLKNLELKGYKVLHDSNDFPFDTVIINTCGFIHDAKEESINTILNYVRAKEQGLIKRIFVTGCLSQKYMPELKKEIPEVDHFSGVNSVKEIIEHLVSGYEGKENPTTERLITGPGHYAYMKISEGCNRKCAFCAIPQIRGKYISRTIDSLLEETTFLAGKGVKELILIAQDLNYYGVDIYKKRKLTYLIQKILEQNYFPWIRLQYLYPEGLNDSLLELIGTESNICKYIDIPIQHVSTRVLRLMKRSYTRKSLENLLAHIREIIPGAAIRTALIVGHPGETKKDFEELKKFISDFRFDRLGVFKYSHEDSTYSFENYNDDIPEEEKEARAAEIMEIQQNISHKTNLEKIDNLFEVIIDRQEGGYYVGRTQFDSPEVDQEVLIDAKYKLTPGLFYKIKITGAEEFDLYGVPAE
ncbi:MAG: 30S ribosomal protein S12 methylthiotransferase RimO [Bacteroidales bacterium]